MAPGYRPSDLLISLTVSADFRNASSSFSLNISVTGSQGDFPISNVKIIVTVNDAAQAGGLSSLSINGDPITTFTPGAPSYYGASGGPFSEPDFYGYNDQYTITS